MTSHVCTNVCCSNQTTGGWSSDGIIQDIDNEPTVLCNTTHLTSFSVLVSYKMEKSSEVHKSMCTYFILCITKIYVTGPAKINHVSANYTKLYFC